MAEIDRIERLVGRLNAFAGITPASPNGFTQLNDAARELVKDAATELRLLLDELSRLRGREEEYRKALEPFAKAADCHSDDTEFMSDRMIVWEGGDDKIRLGDLRRARALSPTNQKGDQDGGKHGGGCD